MRIAVLAHEQFPDRAKTALGLLRYADHEPVAVLDRATAGDRVRDHVTDDRVRDVPIVADVDAAPAFDVLAIGISPIGGAFEPSWRPDVLSAIERGATVWSGLHDFLADDAAIAAAADPDQLWDVRRPPADLAVAEGTVRELDARVVLTMGTDCSVGKMTTTCELVAAAEAAGLDAAFVPTGQTGVMIDGDGIVVDRVVADFVAGAVERLCHERADHDLLIVEGQGAIGHPAYSGVTCGILHGAMPDAIVLCHEAGRDRIHGYEAFPTTPPATLASLTERLAAPVAETTVAAGALNTSGLATAPAREAVADLEAAIDAPATDPLRFGAAPLVEAVT